MVFILVCGESLGCAVLWGRCTCLSPSSCLVWLGSAEVLHEKAATTICLSRGVTSVGNLHCLSCCFKLSLQGTPARWRDFHSATIIGTKMYVFGGRADRFGPFHSNNEIYCNRIKVFDTETNSWLDSPPTPVLPEGRRSHSACECGAAGRGERGKEFPPIARGCLLRWVEVWDSEGCSEPGFCGELQPVAKPCVQPCV